MSDELERRIVFFVALVVFIVMIGFVLYGMYLGVIWLGDIVNG